MPDIYDTETHRILESQDLAALMVAGRLDPRYVIVLGGQIPGADKVSATPREYVKAIPMTANEAADYRAAIGKFGPYVQTPRKLWPMSPRERDAVKPPAVAPVEP